MITNTQVNKLFCQKIYLLAKQGHSEGLSSKNCQEHKTCKREKKLPCNSNLHFISITKISFSPWQDTKSTRLTYGPAQTLINNNGNLLCHPTSIVQQISNLSKVLWHTSTHKYIMGKIERTQSKVLSVKSSTAIVSFLTSIHPSFYITILQKL